jgi:hypothetical protein
MAATIGSARAAAVVAAVVATIGKAARLATSARRDGCMGNSNNEAAPLELALVETRNKTGRLTDLGGRAIMRRVLREGM